MALVMSTATGFKSLACASSPNRCASSGIAPPPAKGSWNPGSLFRSNSSPERGWSAFSAQARRQLCHISARALPSTSSSVVLSQRTSSRKISNSRSRSCSAAMSRSACPSSARPPRFLSSRRAARLFEGSDSSTSTYSDGSSTIWAKRTARAAASGRRAHQRWSVEGWPWRMDFSRAAALLMASSGNATSISFLAITSPMLGPLELSALAP